MNQNRALSSCSSLLNLFVSKLVPLCDSDRTYAVSLSETLSIKASQVSVLQFDHSVACFPSDAISVAQQPVVTVEGTFSRAQQPTGTLSGQCVC